MITQQSDGTLSLYHVHAMFIPLYHTMVTKPLVVTTSTTKAEYAQPSLGHSESVECQGLVLASSA